MNNEIIDRIKKNDELFKAATPAWAKSVIVAQLVERDCDGQTDYYGSRTVRKVVIGWSKHTRNLFPELRKMAGSSEIPEVRALKDAPKTAEHRENYSMGAGTYLKNGDRYDTGWEIFKNNLGYFCTQKLDVEALAKLTD